MVYYTYISIVIITTLALVLAYVINLYIQCSRKECPTATQARVVCPSLELQRELRQPERADKRDALVLNDPLYPPLNRDHTMRVNHYIDNTRLHSERTRPDSSDAFRLVGYMVSSEDANDSWKLFARDTGRGRASFYAIPSNKNNDIKVPLNQDNVVGPEKLRDIYDIPNHLVIQHPLFQNRSYNIIELDKSDYTSQYI